MVFAVVANKMDLNEYKGVVNNEKAKVFADKIGAIFQGVSQRFNNNQINDLFNKIGRAYIEKKLDSEKYEKSKKNKIEKNLCICMII